MPIKLISFALLSAIKPIILFAHPPFLSPHSDRQLRFSLCKPNHLTHITDLTALTKRDHLPWHPHSPFPVWCFCPASSCLLTEVCLCSIITVMLLNHWQIQDMIWVRRFLGIVHLSCAAELTLWNACELGIWRTHLLLCSLSKMHPDSG